MLKQPDKQEPAKSQAKAGHYGLWALLQRTPKDFSVTSVSSVVNLSVFGSAMPQLPIFMDSHSTTPVDRRVVEAMLPFFAEHFGNASSRTHAFGWRAAEGVERARQQIARLIGASPKDIIFTSGATESDNLAILGAARAHRARGRHLVTVTTEHRAVLDPCRQLEREGFEISWVPVRTDGLLDLDRLIDELRPHTVLVSVMAANNEIGVLQPLAAIGQLTRERGILFHTDAAQAAGKIPFDVGDVQADLVSITAHKIYGPKGVGALYVRRRTELTPILFGGGHERGLRSGTLNVPGIVGFGAAAELCLEEMTSERQRLGALRDRLNAGLHERLDSVLVNGSLSERLSHNLNLSFMDVDGDSLLTGLSDVAVSSGAACTSTSKEPSHVLRAIGRTEDLARASLRFGLSRFNTAEDVDYVVDKVASLVTRLRQGSAFDEFASDAADPTSRE
jgi:cysteine desulfurase